MSNQQTIRIGIVDDHTLMRDGLLNLLAEYDDIEPLFKAANSDELETCLLPDDLPDIVLMDINLPGKNGHELTRWMKDKYPTVKVLALSMYEDEKNIIGMLKSGADGYMLKECKVQELVRAIQITIQHGYFINEVVSGRLMRNVKDDNIKLSDVILTPREKEFIALCCSELTYKEIGDKMNVSARTVDGYREALFIKLELKSRTGLVLFAVKNGYVSL